MPSLNVDGIDLHYIERGDGPETVVFSHSFLADHRHFEAQVDAVAEEFRVIAYDHRDHGQSGRATAPYGIDDLVADGRAVIERTSAAPCHWVGLSTGGFVGMRLAIRHPELLRSLVLMDTSGAREPFFGRLRYDLLLTVVRWFGVGPVLQTATRSMFGRTSLARRPAWLPVWMERFANNSPEALIRFGTAIWSRDDVLDALRQVTLPTRVITGAEDVPLPVSHGQALADAIPGAQLSVIEQAGHLCTVEQPEAVNAVLLPFLREASQLRADEP